MTLKAYFEHREGLGILSTADESGAVNAVVYAKPHFMEDGQIAFIMREKLTYKNIQANPKACYLFAEKDKYEGKRLYLTKTKEEDNAELIETMRRKIFDSHSDSDGKVHLVYFTIDKILPLVGSAESKGCPHHHK
ncbi:pyridoxamine 5'-phosphate oxidase family protein [Heliorestis acidaminivorans]|uniref:Pyridoxamine 5'-phosphate oxidase family protein n=1 Tax=Heliorestis acidaminivorans TaxID=553427 RepID=A0A6I0EZ36_9FIRM|nr:pyridoxamine 5'-phosphate oxidase family protein [Heliorestis acidaminivorans]KAB2951866.1 pyridoxamine 5'-phosphate oxidase family protein [Heliorestis acidaminivorans]